MTISAGSDGRGLPLVRDEEEAGRGSTGMPGQGPGALWGLGQVATYLGRSRETVRLCWQATKTRAVNPSAAAVRDALPVPDFLIPDNANGIHGFFHVGGDQLIGDWWTLPAVRPAWRPKVIAAWASTTGRAVREHDGGGYRLPVPHYLDLPSLPAPLPRTVDQVLDIPVGYHSTDTRGLHVRIWDGPLPAASDSPAEGVRRTVVLLAAAGEDYGFPQREDELAALLIDSALLTPDQARRALWFLQSPPRQPEVVEGGRIVHRPGIDYISFEIALHSDAQSGELSRRQRLGARIAAVGHRIDGDDDRPLHDPTRLPASVADLEHLIGERLEIYPPGTQTPEIIARWNAGERPVRLAWDPYRLRDHLTHLPEITGALATARADLAASPDDANLARRAAALRAAGNWIADLAISKADNPLTGHSYADDQLRAVELDIPAPTAEQRALLNAALADDEQGPYVVTVLLRDLAAVAELAAPAPATPAGEQPTADTALGDALRDAVTILNDHFRIHSITFDEQFPARIEETAPARPDGDGESADAAAYLTTIAWWGPRPEDRQTADNLVRLFYDHERQHGVQHGYDPFGRLVIRCPAAHAFAITWPTHGPITVAHVTGLHPGFRRLPDGRVDLMPIGDSAT